MGNNKKWEDFLNTKVTDAVTDYLKGHADSNLKAASAIPFVLGDPDIAKELYYRFDEKNPNVFHRYGKWNADIGRDAGIAAMQTAAMLTLKPNLVDVIGSPTKSSVLGGGLAIADNEMEKQIQARMLGDFRSKEEASRDFDNGAINTSIESGAAAGQNSNNSFIKAVSGSMKKYQLSRPLGFWIDENRENIENIGNHVTDYLYKKRLEQLMESVKNNQDD